MSAGESGHLRQPVFHGVMLHFLNHTIKARERERERLVFTVQRAREEGERGIASFTESDLCCGVEEKEESLIDDFIRFN